jgi:hypothetical protein
MVFDIDAMLRKPEVRARRIRLWRDVGSYELNGLLDQLETVFQDDTVAGEADAPGMSGPSESRNLGAANMQ